MDEIKKARVTFFINLALMLYAASMCIIGIQEGKMYKMIFAVTGFVGFAVFSALTYTKIQRLKKENK